MADSSKKTAASLVVMEESLPPSAGSELSKKKKNLTKTKQFRRCYFCAADHAFESSDQLCILAPRPTPIPPALITLVVAQS